MSDERDEELGRAARVDVRLDRPAHLRSHPPRVPADAPQAGPDGDGMPPVQVARSAVAPGGEHAPTRADPLVRVSRIGAELEDLAAELAELEALAAELGPDGEPGACALWRLRRAALTMRLENLTTRITIERALHEAR